MEAREIFPWYWWSEPKVLDETCPGPIPDREVAVPIRVLYHENDNKLLHTCPHLSSNSRHCKLFKLDSGEKIPCPNSPVKPKRSRGWDDNSLKSLV